MVRKLTKEELNYLNEHRHEVRKHTKEEKFRKFVTMVHEARKAGNFTDDGLLALSDGSKVHFCSDPKRSEGCSKRKLTKEELSEIRKHCTEICIRPKMPKPGPKHRITVSDADYQTLKILAAKAQRSVPAFVHLLAEVTKAKNPQFFKK